MGILDRLFLRKREHNKSTTPINIVYKGFSHLYNNNECFSDEFYTNLSKTIAYTENVITGIKDINKVDFSKVLRTVNPLYNGALFYTYSNFDGYNNVIHAERPFNYDLLIKDILKLRIDLFSVWNDNKERGKVLRFDIDISTYDGAPCAASQGFVDAGDIPPIDTWFYVTKSHLYCWIPKMFLPVMEDVIAVEILDSYRWLEQIDADFNSETFKRLEGLR
jgi:hypothetical protein